MRLLVPLIATVLASVFLAGTATPAQAKQFGSNSDNWAGVIGKPIALGSAPITHAEIYFDIPKLTCDGRQSMVSIWTGMDTTSGKGQGVNVTQAGIAGRCRGGKASWDGWYEAAPDFDMTYIPQLANLSVGDQAFVQVNYRPDISATTFVADFRITGHHPDIQASQAFTTLKGSQQRARAECIVERPWFHGTHLPLPQFTGVAGPLHASCVAGAGQTQALIGGAQSNFIIDTMVSGHTLVSVSIVNQWVLYQWRAST